MLALAAAGCNTPGPTSLADARGAAITFESIEGPPPQVVQKFERDISEEASARQIAVMPRGGGAPYRIRGYLAPSAGPEASSIAWAWDVYDGDQRRAFRLTGVEPAGTGRQSLAGSWAAADDAALRRSRAPAWSSSSSSSPRPRPERRPRRGAPRRAAYCEPAE
jgi:hypothetical protein